jgi:hypothetical protein
LDFDGACEDDGVFEGVCCEGTDDGRAGNQGCQSTDGVCEGSDDGPGEGNVDGGSESFDGAAFAAGKEAGN